MNKIVQKELGLRSGIGRGVERPIESMWHQERFPPRWKA